MGVLESIKVKQENFPYRKKYEDFYRLYEILSPGFAEGRYDTMPESTREMKRDESNPKGFKMLSEEIIKRVFSPLDQSEYSHFYKCGRTKILKMAEVRAALQASRNKASAIYDKYSRMIKRSYTVASADERPIIRLASLIKLQKAMKKWYQKI
jgi:myosin heavy subunit